MTDDGSGRLVRFSATDGLILAARIFGEPAERLPVLCLPGLTRNSRDFIALGRSLASDVEAPRRVVALDYRGRGASDYDSNWRNYSVLTEAQDVLTAATAFGLEEAIVLGTSRGGLIAMTIGALRPGLLAGVILNDIGPVVEGTGLARIKAYITHAGPVSNWENAAGAVKRINSNFFPHLDDDDWRSLAEAIFRSEGRFLVPDYDPKLVKAVSDIDLEYELPQMWPQFDSLARVPLFVIRGENSDLLSAETVEAMADRHPTLERMVVAGEGHAPLLRDPRSIGRVAAFAHRCDAARASAAPAP